MKPLILVWLATCVAVGMSAYSIGLNRGLATAQQFQVLLDACVERGRKP